MPASVRWLVTDIWWLFSGDGNYMRKIRKCCVAICLVVSIFVGNSIIPVTAENENDIQGLYALSAVLMDADTGRVLYEKEGYVERAMASTTKIMTCIIALEYGKLDDVVTVSRYAASMPDVQLNMQEGERYVLKDLLYSLMLESHNDTAVAIAEHVAGSVEAFAELMNQKAAKLGCNNTYFITPNGLDASKEVGGETKIHSTTARDLAVIMSYCIKNEDFLDITRTMSHTFSNKIQDKAGNVTDGNRVYTVSNKNALLGTMEGIISGKTGFTGDAGYCYVCAFENDGRKYVVALLGCGWPNNKTYKWSDTKKLLNYGMENYTKKDSFIYDMKLPAIEVENGVDGCYNDFGTRGINAGSKVLITPNITEEELVLLINKNENVTQQVTICEKLEAPVYKGQVIGRVDYMIDNMVLKSYEIHADKTVEKKDYTWSVGCIFMKFILH